ncbi:MAG: peptidoglycan-binding protein [Chthoniobacterales bacterium]|nr:peptidoglycan-binding protein [Chthoniobacterales bacterium]
MKTFTSLLIGCSLALAGAAFAQEPEEEASPAKRGGKKQEAQTEPGESGNAKAKSRGNAGNAGRQQAAEAQQQGAANAQSGQDRGKPGKGRGGATSNRGAASDAGMSGATETTETSTPESSGTASSATGRQTQQSRGSGKERGAKATASPARAAASETPASGTDTATTEPTAATTTATASATPASATASPSESVAAASATASPTASVAAATAPDSSPGASEATQTTGQTTTGAAVKKPEPQVVQQVEQQYSTFRAEPRPQQVPTVTFQQNYRIQGVEQWQGPQYEVYRSYRPERHDAQYYRSRYSRVELVGGGYYYFNNGYWYPAWGYSPQHEYYAYDAPIYVGKRAMPPDQVIAKVQAVLQRMGYYKGEVDGLLGPLTRRALTAYQTDSGLIRTAVIDEPTLDALGMS